DVRDRPRERGHEPGDARTRLRRQLARRKQPRRLSDRVHSQYQREEPWAGAGQRGHAHSRCVRCVAADRAADARSGDVSLPVWLYPKVAGTEIGVTEPEATFSTCFGAPFMPRHPSIYGNLLKERIAKGGVQCWLLNTGWTGGKYGTGSRMPIKATRALLNAALDGSLNDAEFRKDPNFGFDVPVSVP